MASTLDIAPALGHGIVTAQNLPGGYDAIDDRRQWSVGRQEGAVTSGAYAVTQRSGGATLSVDIATNAGPYLVQGDDVLWQGLYLIPATALKTNLTLATPPDPTNPRVDQVVLEARDDAHRLDGITRGRVYILSGTPTAGASVVDSAAYNASRAALPPSTARLAEFVVGANAASITTANIRDRRTFANGFKLGRRGDASGNYTTVSTTAVSLAAGRFDFSFEKGDNSAVEVLFAFESTNVGGSICTVQLTIDGGGVRISRAQGAAGNAVLGMLSYRSDVDGGLNVLAPGRHDFSFQLSTTNAANAATIVNSDARFSPVLTVREVLL